MLKLKIVKRSLILGEVDVVADMAVEDMAVDVVEVDMAVDVGVVDMAAAAVIHFFSLSWIECMSKFFVFTLVDCRN